MSSFLYQKDNHRIQLKLCKTMSPTYVWGIPSEKIGQNIHPCESHFLVINYQYWTGTSAFRPFLAPSDLGGGLGGFGGVLGGLQNPKMILSF